MGLSMVSESVLDATTSLALRSSLLIGFAVGLLLSLFCSPFVGIANTLRMVLRAQMGSLVFAAGSQLLGIVALVVAKTSRSIVEDPAPWMAESALSACTFSVGNMFGAVMGSVMGTMFSIRFGSLMAVDVEEEWTALARLAMEDLEHCAPLVTLTKRT